MCKVTNYSQSAVAKPDRTVQSVRVSLRTKYLCGSLGLPSGRYWELCVSAVKRTGSELCLLLMLRMPGVVPPHSKHINNALLWERFFLTV